MPRPERFVPDPVDRSREWEDRVHAHDVGLDRDRYAPAALLCGWCGKSWPDALDTCAVCGDDDEPELEAA